MKNFLYIVLFFVLLSSCDYEPIFSNKKEKFNIVNFEIENKNNITKQLINSLKRNNSKEASKIYTIKLSAERNKEITSRDSKGNARVYRVNINCSFKIYEKNKLIKTKQIDRSFMFNEDEDKFKLNKYVSNLEKNLINEIVKDLVLELYSS